MVSMTVLGFRDGDRKTLSHTGVVGVFYTPSFEALSSFAPQSLPRTGSGDEAENKILTSS